MSCEAASRISPPGIPVADQNGDASVLRYFNKRWLCRRGNVVQRTRGTRGVAARLFHGLRFGEELSESRFFVGLEIGRQELRFQRLQLGDDSVRDSAFC
jgi:hypothetical protein